MGEPVRVGIGSACSCANPDSVSVSADVSCRRWDKQVCGTSPCPSTPPSRASMLLYGTGATLCSACTRTRLGHADTYSRAGLCSCRNWSLSVTGHRRDRGQRTAGREAIRRRALLRFPASVFLASTSQWPARALLRSGIHLLHDYQSRHLSPSIRSLSLLRL